MKATERRSSPRHSLDLAARMTVEQRSLPARLRSLSRMGALVAVEEPFPVGVPLSLFLELPNAQGVLTLRGQVVRTEESEGAFALGILLAPMTPGVLAQIDALLGS